LWIIPLNRHGTVLTRAVIAGCFFPRRCGPQAADKCPPLFLGHRADLLLYFPIISTSTTIRMDLPTQLCVHGRPDTNASGAGLKWIRYFATPAEELRQQGCCYHSQDVRKQHEAVPHTATLEFTGCGRDDGQAGKFMAILQQRVCNITAAQAQGVDHSIENLLVEHHPHTADAAGAEGQTAPRGSISATPLTSELIIHGATPAAGPSNVHSTAMDAAADGNGARIPSQLQSQDHDLHQRIQEAVAAMVPTTPPRRNTHRSSHRNFHSARTIPYRR
jgi:hypothetical protein